MVSRAAPDTRHWPTSSSATSIHPANSPITFPKSETGPAASRHSAAVIARSDQGSQAVNAGTHVSGYSVTYDEGPEVGYKWFEAQHKQPLFPFGFGLSYTTYAYSGLNVDPTAKTVSFTVKNTGKHAGTEIAEVYAKLPQGADESYKRLVGWRRVALAPGESKTVTVAIDPRVLKTFNEVDNRWNLASGEYAVFVGPSSEKTLLTGSLLLHEVSRRSRKADSMRFRPSWISPASS